MSDRTGTRMRGGVRLLVLAMLIVLGIDRGQASAQLGALVSPGRLSKAHASLEGVANCLSCHTAGRQVAANKCLSCHKPVAERMAAKIGVHRRVTTDCVTCHVEHAGVDAELRPFDQRRFDHAADTRFPLDGLHAPLAANCVACHKTRSFLTVTTTCVSCHQDVHKGALGADCATCHPTSVRFTDTRVRFDHARTAFALTGAHAKVTCESCHPNGAYTRTSPATCATCHEDPHQPRLGTTCTTCHTTASWTTTKIDHTRTSFPLRGRHADVQCAACHVKPAAVVALRHDRCAACHSDPHRGEFPQDCASCHTERTFTKGTFDHSTTRFALVEGHAGLTCASCHKDSAPVTPVASAARRRLPPPPRTIDFRGLGTACATCHEDPHKDELGKACETCHSVKTFGVPVFRHARQRPFFDGGHAALRCAQCHVTGTTVASRVPLVGLRDTPTECVSCHRDVHVGQVGTRCESCHAIDAPRFAVVGFSHDKTVFPLTGKHAPLMCAACHKKETAAFPSGAGAATRLTGVGMSCVSCHADPHAAQLGPRCEQCHTSETFQVSRYVHQNVKALSWFFAGPHVKVSCEACHTPASPTSGAPRVAPVIAYRLATTCTACHEDTHRGSLGPRCESCHRLN